MGRKWEGTKAINGLLVRPHALDDVEWNTADHKLCVLEFFGKRLWISGAIVAEGFKTLRDAVNYSQGYAQALADVRRRERIRELERRTKEAKGPAVPRGDEFWGE